jgi:hypothetical protein
MIRVDAKQMVVGLEGVIVDALQEGTVRLEGAQRAMTAALALLRRRGFVC